MSLTETRSAAVSSLYPLILRLEAMVLFSFLAAAGFSAVAVLDETLPAWVVSLAAAGGSGMLLGLASRWMFRASGALFRWMAAFTASSISVVFMAWLTRGLLGADPALPAGTRPDWFAFSLVVLSGATAALALAAWPREESRGGVAIEPAEPAERAAIAAASDPPAAPRTPAREPVRRTARTPARRPARARTPVRVPTREAAPAPAVRHARTPVRERVRRLWTRFRRPEPAAEVRLLGAEEHKCPYCLQKVEDRDPRGVVTCPICHTRHHKDCWDVTGMCQVPHFHE